MASSTGYRRMNTEDKGGDDSYASIGFNEQSQDCVALEVSLIDNMRLFISVFDSNISKLKSLISKLTVIIDNMERIHRSTTIGSLSGGVIGAAGGITSIVGLALAPFTLGVSLIVTGVGIGVSVAGGVTGGASNITGLVYQKSCREEIEQTLNAIQDILSPIVQHLTQQKQVLDEIKRSPQLDSLMKHLQAVAGVGRGLGYAAEGLRLLNFLELSKVAAQASRAVKAAGALTGVFSSLFLLLDIGFIAKDAKELHEIDNQQRGDETKSDTVQLIQEMRRARDNLRDAVEKINTFRNEIPNVTKS